MQPQDNGGGGGGGDGWQQSRLASLKTYGTNLNSVVTTTTLFPSALPHLPRINISYLLCALKPHSLPPTPQLILSIKPFIHFRKMEANGQKLPQLLPTIPTYCIPTYLPASQCPILLKEILFLLPYLNPSLMSRAPSLCCQFPLSCIYFKLSFFTGSFLSAANPALLQ